MKQIIILLTIFVIVYSNTCGGNCPTDCPTCLCGNKKNIVNITTVCNYQPFTWNKTCCKCIV